MLKCWVTNFPLNHSKPVWFLLLWMCWTICSLQNRHLLIYQYFMSKLKKIYLSIYIYFPESRDFTCSEYDARIRITQDLNDNSLWTKRRGLDIDETISEETSANDDHFTTLGRYALVTKDLIDFKTQTNQWKTLSNLAIEIVIELNCKLYWELWPKLKWISLPIRCNSRSSMGFLVSLKFWCSQCFVLFFEYIINYLILRSNRDGQWLYIHVYGPWISCMQHSKRPTVRHVEWVNIVKFHIIIVIINYDKDLLEQVQN